MLPLQLQRAQPTNRARTPWCLPISITAHTQRAVSDLREELTRRGLARDNAITERDAARQLAASLEVRLAVAERAATLPQPDASVQQLSETHTQHTRELASALSMTQAQLRDAREDAAARMRAQSAAESALAATRAESSALAAALARSQEDAQQLHERVVKLVSSAGATVAAAAAASQPVEARRDGGMAAEIASMRREVDTSRSELRALRSELHAATKALAGSRARIAQLEEDDDESQRDMAELGEELDGLRESLRRQQQINERLTSHLQQLLDVDGI